jgi:hypothetical protein
VVGTMGGDRIWEEQESGLVEMKNRKRSKGPEKSIGMATVSYLCDRHKEILPGETLWCRIQMV